jgi:hypothetical protein
VIPPSNGYPNHGSGGVSFPGFTAGIPDLLLLFGAEQLCTDPRGSGSVLFDIGLNLLLRVRQSTIDVPGHPQKGVGMFGVARGLEDWCLAVTADRGYGASSVSASVWPPRFTFELAGPVDASAADPFAVEQPGVALLRTGWTLGFPVAWLVLGAAVLLRWAPPTR